MSDMIQKLFDLAIEDLPYIPNPAMEKAEAALENRLGQDSETLLRDYENAWLDRHWENMKYIFYMALSLGIELGPLTPSADASHRR